MSGLFSISSRRIWAVLKKEFIQLLRDKTTFRMIVGIPIIQLLLFGYAINSDPRNLPTVVLAQDHSVIARDVLTGFKNSGYFDISYETSSEKEMHELLQKGEVIFAITIPDQFTRELVRGEHPYILVEADATDPVAISGALGAVNNAMKEVMNRDAQGALSSFKTGELPYEVRIHRKYNPEGLSRYNIVPGLIAIVLTMTGIMMTALSLTRERERGTMENLLSMPVKPIEVMAGKVLPYVMIGYLQSAIIVATAHFLFGVPILGSLLLFSLGLLIFIICNLALGFTLSAKASNQTQALQMSIFIVLPSILLSGFMFPFLGMPRWAQMLGSLLPATYFIRISRGIMLKGATLAEIAPSLWALVIFMLVITAIAMSVYKKTLD